MKSPCDTCCWCDENSYFCNNPKTLHMTLRMPKTECENYKEDKP